MVYDLEKIEEVPGLTDRVYKVIREGIISKNIPAGTKLTVDNLSKELNVSRTPVKEALLMLAKEGLVKIVPRKGTFVNSPTLKDAEEIYDLREVLEGLVARRAAVFINDDTICKLKEIVDKSREYVEKNQPENYSNLDEEFHMLIRLQSRNDRLLRILESIEGEIRILMTTSVVLPGRMKKSLEEHEKILSALEKRDPELAEFYTREHIKAVRKAVLEIWEKVL